MAIYGGAAPLVWIADCTRRCPRDEPHVLTGLALWLAALVWLVLAAVTLAFVSTLITSARETYEAFAWDATAVTFLRRGLLAVGICWLWAAGFGVAGKFGIPLAAQLLAGRYRLQAGIVIASLGVVLLASLAVALGNVRAWQSIDAPVQAPVQLLYDDLDYFPRWVFALGFSRLAGNGYAAHGLDAVRIAELSRENIALALQHGEFVVLASHGTKDGLILPAEWLPPSEVETMPRGEGLAFVYLSGSDSGQQQREWEAALAPARVVTYPRLTSVLEHVWWMWIEGPALVGQVQRQELEPD